MGEFKGHKVNQSIGQWTENNICHNLAVDSLLKGDICSFSGLHFYLVTTRIDLHGLMFNKNASVSHTVLCCSTVWPPPEYQLAPIGQLTHA